MGTTIEEARRLRALCEQYQLENREILAGRTDEELAAVYNGIGPKAFPAWLRAALDAVHPSLAPVAFIHDVEWSESDGTEGKLTPSQAARLHALAQLAYEGVMDDLTASGASGGASVATPDGDCKEDANCGSCADCTAIRP